MITIIKNSYGNKYAVHINSNGNYDVLGIKGIDEGRQYENTPEVYHRWVTACGYQEVTKLQPSFIESYMEEYQCACIEAINCLLSPCSEPFTFHNGRVKSAYLTVVDNVLITTKP